MNRNILIVDDERALAQLLCAHLTNEGNLVYTANHTQEAMGKLNIAPGLILLDTWHYVARVLCCGFTRYRIYAGGTTID